MILPYPTSPSGHERGLVPLFIASCKTNEALFTNGTLAPRFRLLGHSADVHADFYRVKLNVASVESVSA